MFLQERTEYRTTDVPPPIRLEYWRDVVSDAMFPVDLVHHPVSHDAGRLVAGDVGELRLARIDSRRADCAAEHRRRHITHAGLDAYHLLVAVSGTLGVEQDDRRTLIGTGGAALIDDDRPARCVLPRQSSISFVSVRIPRRRVPLPQGEVAGLTATALGPGEPISALCGTIARGLGGTDGTNGTDGINGVRLGGALVDLLTVTLSERLGRDRPVPERQAELLKRVLTHIEDNLGDPELSPATVAAAHFISVRHLHNLFRAERTTVGGWIRHRRLERCRKEMLDPAHRQCPIAAIAARWGFVSAAHFSRAFRDAYGVAPRDYRLGSPA